MVSRFFPIHLKCKIFVIEISIYCNSRATQNKDIRTKQLTCDTEKEKMIGTLILVMLLGD